MPRHECDECGATEESGAGFRFCYRYQSSRRGCDAEYCYDDSSAGKQCPRCGEGFLYAPSER
jgi:ribosomal protein S27AE